MRNEEHRIITEAASASRPFEDFAVNSSRDNRDSTALLRGRDYADKVRGALRALPGAQFGEQFRDSLFVARLRSSVARRQHARCAIERGHYQARVVGKNRFPAMARVVQGFAGGVFGESWRVLFELRVRQKAREELQLERVSRRQNLKLLEFACVSRGKIQPFSFAQARLPERGPNPQVRAQGKYRRSGGD